MSEVREHYTSTLLSLDNKMNPEPQVGDQVRNLYSVNNIGLVVEIISQNKCKVLWGEYHDPYSNLIGEPGYFYSPNIPLQVTLPGELNQISIDLKVGNE
jgi:hypothetical protein